MVRLVRSIVLVTAVVAVLGSPFQAQTRDASAVLADMRQALGGAAALDAVTTFSVRGTVRKTRGGFTKNLSTELLAMLPDRFLEVRRDTGGSGPLPLDITYYNGFRGDTLLRRTDANIPFPPDPVPNTPAAQAAHERQMLLSQKQEFARLTLILFGRAFDSYPMQFDYIGITQVDGRNLEVIEASAADGYRMRLSVDAVTHLPVMISYVALQPVMVSTSSTVTMQGGQVRSRSDAPMPNAPSLDSMPKAVQRLTASDFKAQDGLNWPRKLSEETGGKIVSTIDFGKFQINPSIKPSRFEIGR